MRFDQVAIAAAQRRAFEMLANPHIHKHLQKTDALPATGTLPAGHELVKHADGHHSIKSPNPYFVDPRYITEPATLVQELPIQNPAIQQYQFDFSINGPQQTPGTNNNVTIGKNNVFAFYGIQLLLGTPGLNSLGNLTSALMDYNSSGTFLGDFQVYNSILQLRIESALYVDKFNGLSFRDEYFGGSDKWNEQGLILINPLRVVTGELGTFQFALNLLNQTANIVTSGTNVLSLRLHGVLGQPKG